MCIYNNTEVPFNAYYYFHTQTLVFNSYKPKSIVLSFSLGCNSVLVLEVKVKPFCGINVRLHFVYKCSFLSGIGTDLWLYFTCDT